MSNSGVYVYGAGGHGKVVADICLAAGMTVLGFIDDAAEGRGAPSMGLRCLGNRAWLVSQVGHATERPRVALGVGNNPARRAVTEYCIALGFELVTAVHPSAVVARTATLGPGTVVAARGVVNPDATLGIGCIVNTGAVVEHDNELGNYVHVSPNAATGGNVTIGSETHLGLGAVVLPGVTIGANSVVGAGLVVLRNLPEGITAVGNPARILRGMKLP